METKRSPRFDAFVVSKLETSREYKKSLFLFLNYHYPHFSILFSKIFFPLRPRETFFLAPRSIKIGKLAALRQNYFNKFHIEIRVQFRISFLPRLTSVRKESEHKRQQFDSSRHLSDSAWFLTFNSR